MSEKKRVKAPSLLKSRKLKIGKYAEANPSKTHAEIAAEFSITDAQARRAIEQYNNGELDRKRTREPIAKIKKTMETMSLTEIINDQLHYGAAALFNANYLSADEKIASLKNLVITRNMVAKQELSEHMKGIDAGFVCFLYRRYKDMNLTDSQIIALFHEDLERWKRDEKES